MKKRLLGTLVVSAAVIVMMSAVVFSTPVKADGYGSFVDGEHVISDMIKKNGEKFIVFHILLLLFIHNFY